LDRAREAACQKDIFGIVDLFMRTKLHFDAILSICGVVHFPVY